MTTPRISVVICAYADWRWTDLVTAVTSVEQQSTPAAEIIVAVDHNDLLLQRVRQELPQAVAVPNSEHQGLSGTRNCGLAVCQGDCVAFLDDDAIAGSDWLTFLGQGFEDPRVAGVGGSIEPLWDTARPAWFPPEFDWVIGCTYQGLPETPASVRNLIGANMAYRRELFEHVGKFRSGIGRIGVRPLGCEETEFCIRVLQRYPDRIFLYDPRARIQHRVPQSRTTWSYYLRRCYAEGQSKTMVSQLVGGNDGLASERQYTLHTLPAGVARDLKEAALGRDMAGMGRAAAIVTGLTATTAGFAISQVASRVANNQQGHGRIRDRTGTGSWRPTTSASLASEACELSEQELANQHR